MMTTAMSDSTRVQSRPRVVQYTTARIEVTAGPNRGLAFESPEPADRPIRIGSSNDNDVVLEDDTVSRRHCEIHPTTEGVVVRDCDSTNGVVSAGIRVVEARFLETFTLKLGSTTLVVTLVPRAADRELSSADRFGSVLGTSPRMRALFADLERIARSDASLLIEGETGTGKEVIAESVHRQSTRTAGPFVVFDCSAFAPTLVESELFGHEKHAFTGANRSHEGVFEQAHGGTIFLDELGELPLDMQPKLLRVLQERKIKRLGSQRERTVDVRLISATNRSLRAEVQSRRFRSDLYYRVAQISVSVPPLRERREDVPLLAEFFLSQASPPRGRSDIPQGVWDMLERHRWPGNVRELQNVLQRLLVLPESGLPQELGATTAPGVGALPKPLQVARREASEDFERRYLKDVLSRTDGNVSAAAAMAGVSRQMIHRLMQKHGIEGASSESVKTN